MVTLWHVGDQQGHLLAAWHALHSLFSVTLKGLYLNVGIKTG